MVSIIAVSCPETCVKFSVMLGYSDTTCVCVCVFSALHFGSDCRRPVGTA